MNHSYLVGEHATVMHLPVWPTRGGPLALCGEEQIENRQFTGAWDTQWDHRRKPLCKSCIKTTLRLKAATEAAA